MGGPTYTGAQDGTVEQLRAPRFMTAFEGAVGIRRSTMTLMAASMISCDLRRSACSLAGRPGPWTAGVYRDTGPA
jgi:hypothetical protein